MTKRELINALEASPLPDNTEVEKSYWVDSDDSTGYETTTGIYSVLDSSERRHISGGRYEDVPLIVL